MNDKIYILVTEIKILNLQLGFELYFRIDRKQIIEVKNFQLINVERKYYKHKR